MNAAKTSLTVAALKLQNIKETENLQRQQKVVNEDARQMWNQISKVAKD